MIMFYDDNAKLHKKFYINVKLRVIICGKGFEYKVNEKI